MVIIITGATHTGKTRLAQELMERLHFPYVCQDHIKMGLIRSGNTALTPDDDDQLTAYLWPITCEMIKTVIENDQNLIVEGCYVPFDWKKDFEPPVPQQACPTPPAEQNVSNTNANPADQNTNHTGTGSADQNANHTGTGSADQNANHTGTGSADQNNNHTATGSADQNANSTSTCPADQNASHTGMDSTYLEHIEYVCLCLGEQYIRSHFDDILAHASCIEHRVDDEYCTQDLLIRENRKYLEGCRTHNLPYVLIEEDYRGSVDNLLENMSFSQK